MTTRNLSALFRPKTIALIGASNQPWSVGAVIAANLASGGFPGRLLMVNPHASEIAGLACWPTVDALPVEIDLAVVATPPATLPAIISKLGERGARAAIVITAGLSASLRQQMLDAAKPRLLRILGPNCLGFLSPGVGINASFSQSATPARPPRPSLSVRSDRHLTDRLGQWPRCWLLAHSVAGRHERYRLWRCARFSLC